MCSLLERYEACMVLHAVGDSMGFKAFQWEGNTSTHDIHRQLGELGGIEALNLEPKNWPVSDDTILHLANAEWLTENATASNSVFYKLIGYYRRALETEDHKKRMFGFVTKTSIALLDDTKTDGYKIPFNPKAYACGASMRSSCIGLRFPKPEQLHDLIEYSLISSKMTHHHPTGYLGGLTAALFTSYAIQERPVKSWGTRMVHEVLPLAKAFIQRDELYLNENIEAWSQFENAWKDYLKLRQIEEIESTGEAIFPPVYDVDARDEFYKKYALNSRYGSSGHDSVIIAYDALLGSQKNWTELCMRAVLHGGDNDSTGAIAASWYGALYGFENVPKCNYEILEYKQRLIGCAKKLYQISFV